MRIKTILAYAVTLAISLGLSARAWEEPKPAAAEAATSPEAKAKADYEAAVVAAQEAQAALPPGRWPWRARLYWPFHGYCGPTHTVTAPTSS